MISFTSREDGSFAQVGGCGALHGRFQWPVLKTARAD